MFDFNRAFEVSDDGLILGGGVHFISGAASPLGVLNPTTPTIYEQTSNGKKWVHAGTGGPTAWYVPLDEAERKVVGPPQFVTTTLNGSENLIEDSNTHQIIQGTATGFTVYLPDATTLRLGRTFDFANTSTQPVHVKDSAGGLIYTMLSGDYLRMELQDNSTAAGLWVTVVTSTTAQSLLSYTVANSTLFSTNSTLDVLITGFETTPQQGTYAVFFNSDIIVGSNNQKGFVSIYKDSSQILDSKRSVQGTSSNWEGIVSTMTIAYFNGAQTCSARISSSSSGSTVSTTNKTLLLVRLGA